MWGARPVRAGQADTEGGGAEPPRLASDSSVTAQHGNGPLVDVSHSLPKVRGA